MIKRFRQRGITIIELMATLAVVGVMVAFGLTSFLENRARQQVTTALSGLDTVRDAAQKWAASERLTPDTGWIAQGQTVSLDLLGEGQVRDALGQAPLGLLLLTSAVMTLPVVATRPQSLRPRSRSCRCSARSFSSARSSCSSAWSSS